MNQELLILCGTTASIGFFHTLLGPDHYLPFIALAKSKQWSNIKLFWITFFCGFGHVLSSVFLGFIGIFAGTALFKLEKIESIRGDVTAWFLLMFGFFYFIWGIYRLIKNKHHTHIHAHSDGEKHIHDHNHSKDHVHPHISKNSKTVVWSLFIIFVFGPCEPLIPLIMYPAARGNILSVLLVATIFTVVTIGTMISIVMISVSGLSFVKMNRFSKYSHIIAGFVVFCCGGAIKFLGL